MPHIEIHSPVRIIESVVPEELVPPTNEVARNFCELQYYGPLREFELALIDLRTGDGQPSEGIIDAKLVRSSQKTGNAVLLAYYDIDPGDQRPVIHMQQDFFSNEHTQEHRMAALRYLTFKACFQGIPKYVLNLEIDYARNDAPGVNEYDLSNLLKFIGNYRNYEWKLVQYMLSHGAEKS